MHWEIWDNSWSLASFTVYSSTNIYGKDIWNYKGKIAIKWKESWCHTSFFSLQFKLINFFGKAIKKSLYIVHFSVYSFQRQIFFFGKYIEKYGNILIYYPFFSLQFPPANFFLVNTLRNMGKSLYIAHFSVYSFHRRTFFGKYIEKYGNILIYYPVFSLQFPPANFFLVITLRNMGKSLYIAHFSVYSFYRQTFFL